MSFESDNGTYLPVLIHVFRKQSNINNFPLGLNNDRKKHVKIVQENNQESKRLKTFQETLKTGIIDDIIGAIKSKEHKYPLSGKLILKLNRFIIAKCLVPKIKVGFRYNWLRIRN